MNHDCAVAVLIGVFWVVVNAVAILLGAVLGAWIGGRR